MSSLKDKTTEYKNEIKSNFKSYNNNLKENIQTQKFNDFLNVVNSTKKNKFINDSIKSLILLKQEENEDNITPDEYISYMENQLNSNEKEENLKNIFNIFCDSNTDKISWNTFPLIAKELGDEEVSNNLLNVIKHSKLYLKDINYEEFLEIMNSESDEEKESYKVIENNNKIKSDFKEDNLNIDEYIDNYEEIPTYKQKKNIKNKSKEYEEELTSSSKSINKISDDIIIEEESEENKISESNKNENDNPKISKRYHRRYRSKKIPNYNNENNNIENINTNHKSFNKYRKKHAYY